LLDFRIPAMIAVLACRARPLRLDSASRSRFRKRCILERDNHVPLTSFLPDQETEFIADSMKGLGFVDVVPRHANELKPRHEAVACVRAGQLGCSRDTDR